jgi:hypothetical protein
MSIPVYLLNRSSLNRRQSKVKSFQKIVNVLVLDKYSGGTRGAECGSVATAWAAAGVSALSELDFRSSIGSNALHSDHQSSVAGRDRPRHAHQDGNREFR